MKFLASIKLICPAKPQRPRLCLRRTFNEEYLQTMKFISSCLDGWNSPFTCFNKKELRRLQAVQVAAARLLTNTTKRRHMTPVSASFHWLSVHFRALSGHGPAYAAHLSDILLRSAGQRLGGAGLLEPWPPDCGAAALILLKPLKSS